MNHDPSTLPPATDSLALSQDITGSAESLISNSCDDCDDNLSDVRSPAPTSNAMSPVDELPKLDFATPAPATFVSYTDDDNSVGNDSKDPKNFLVVRSEKSARARAQSTSPLARPPSPAQGSASRSEASVAGAVLEHYLTTIPKLERPRQWTKIVPVTKAAVKLALQDIRACAHIGQAFWRCHFCGARNVETRHAYRHLFNKGHAGDLANIPCPNACGQTFTRPGNLKRHFYLKERQCPTGAFTGDESVFSEANDDLFVHLAKLVES